MEFVSLSLLNYQNIHPSNLWIENKDLLQSSVSMKSWVNTFASVIQVTYQTHEALVQRTDNVCTHQLMMSFRMKVANAVQVHRDVKGTFTCAQRLNAIDCSPIVLCEMLNYTINSLISIGASGVMQSTSTFKVTSNKETCSGTNYNTFFWQHKFTLKPLKDLLATSRRVL